LDVQEPFARLFTQGMVTKDGAKMSKSRGNVVSPQAIVDRYGADTARSYILFIGPPDQDADWNDQGMEGVHRFLGRLRRPAADAYERLTGARVWEQTWPVADPQLLARPTFQLVCQINGKVRDRVEAPSDATPEQLKALCREAPNVRAHLNGREVVKEVVVPG